MILLAVFCSACSSPEPISELRIGVLSAPHSLDPHFHNEHNTFSILGNIYEGLVSVDGDLGIRPSLAESWENPTELTWLFLLRKDVKFHDGRSMSADDVVFSLNRTRFHPRSAMSSFLVHVREIRAVGPHSVEITTNRPYALLPNNLSFLMIVPRGTPHEIQEPVGTGPFRFLRSEGGMLELARFDEYWRDPALFERVFFAAVETSDARVRLLLDGKLDLAAKLNLEDFSRLEGQDQVEQLDHESLVVEYLLGPMDRPPYSDPRVRLAISLAIDREALVRDALGGFGDPAYQLVGRNVFGYSPEMGTIFHDPDKARSLLVEAGYVDGFDLVLEARDGRPGCRQIAEQLGQVGIRTQVRTAPWSELYPRLEAGEVEFYFGGMLAVSADASDILDSKLHSRDAEQGYGNTNFNAYANADLDRLIERAGDLMDMNERRDVLQEGMVTAMKDLPLIPLFAPRDLYGLRANLDWAPRLDGRIFAYEVRQGR